ncbi:MAG: DPP IV N-terminal domain-containing protein [Deltaproteobacteria bacterium]|nr:DPP IV N-terminal domain-containing protein [Deltaproteobacteria bacterium]
MNHFRAWMCLFAPLVVGCGDDEPGTRRSEARHPVKTTETTGAGSTTETSPAASEDQAFLESFTATHGYTLGRPTAAKPTPDGSVVVFLRSPARSAVNTLYAFDVAGGQTRTLADPAQILGGETERLSPEEAARRERLRLQTGGFVDFQISPDGASIVTTLGGQLFLIAIAGGAATRLPAGESAAIGPRFSPDGSQVAYVRGSDLYVTSLATMTERRLTSDGTADVTNGVAEFVAQEEMGRLDGFWWSPDSTQIAFERADASVVERRTWIDEMSPFSPPQSLPYPRAGKANVAVQLGVIPASGGTPRWIQWDRARFPYLARVTWQKDAPLTLQVQTRDQREVVVLAADPRTGTTSTLLSERDEAWVALHDSLRWITKGQSFLWQTERQGTTELEVRSSTGDLARTIAGAREGYRKLLDVDEAAGFVVVEAGLAPTSASVLRLPLAGGPSQTLTPEPGVHHGTFGEGHAVFVDEHRAIDAPPSLHVRKSDGTIVGELPGVAEALPFELNVEIARIGEGDGWYTAVVKPHTMEPGRRYPVIDRVYGGPGVSAVQEDVLAYLLWQWVADHGFVVAFADNRGTPGRGRTFERAIRDRLAEVPLADQAAAMLEIAKRPDVDPGRIGIFGWSYGGYVSTLAVVRRPDVFKAAMAVAPVTDWADYDTHYTERYLGLPDASPGVYEANSTLGGAASLTRPLMLVHGTADDNVLPSHTLRLAQALHAAQKDYELVLFPGQTHMIANEQMRTRLWTLLLRFFTRTLQGPA